MAALIGQRLVKWQVTESAGLAANASLQQRSEELLTARRGEIASSDGAAMALSQPVHKVIAAPDVMAAFDAGAIADRLSTILGGDPDPIMLKVGDPSRRYAVIADAVEPDRSEIIRQGIESGELPGVALEPVSRRVYPNGSLASHVVGFVNGAGVGQAGVEAFYDEELTGKPGFLIRDQDPLGRNIPVGRYDPLPPQAGANLTLTIDRRIQHMAEQELEGAIAAFGAHGGTILITDPRNGDILAMANRPTFNPAKLHEYAFIGPNFLNPAVSLIFDPGSTFKIMTMAAGLDAGVISPRSTHNLPNNYEYWGVEFRNWDDRTYPNQTMTGVLAKSTNTGAIYVADRLGADKFYAYVRAFGFGKNTGVDLAGEVPGILKTRGHSEWYPSDLAANSFGQSISVTPLQMAAAFGAIANGGMLVKPRVVKSQIYPSGETAQNEPETVAQVVRPDTAKTIIEMMYNAEHTIPTNLALSEKYSTVGKTGTAEIPVSGGILPEQTIASYIGFGPTEAPRVLILVKVDRPSSGTWGSAVASPVFRSLVDRVFSHLRIKPGSDN